jgi:hypothetical protein
MKWKAAAQQGALQEQSMPKGYLLLFVVAAMLVAKAISQEIVVQPANSHAQATKRQLRAAEVEAVALPARSHVLC